MLNLKKVIALVCVFAMVLTTVAFGATYTDVAEDSAYYEAVETLNKLEIVTGYEDGTYKPEDGVTRAEMAALIARIQGYGETAKAGANTAFTDVPASHWASGYIANASGMGIINGYGDGTFGPEDPVLYEQAVKMVMATLGYTPFAEKNGGYPTGYLAAAQRYDVSLAVANAAVGQPANRGTVAQILANALDTPLMIQARWSNTGEVDYVIADGNTTGYPYQTLMSANLGYVKIRGVVTENALVNINGVKNIDTTKEATVVFGNGVEDFQSTNSVWVKDNTAGAITEFLVGDTDVADYIGRSVVGYVKKVGNDWTMISAAIDTARNDELVIALDAFAGHDTTSGKEAVKYYKDGANDVTSVKVSDTIAIVYNNDGDNAYASASPASFDALKGNLAGGAITLVDNNEDRGYDVAFIELATTAVVKKVTEDGINLHTSLFGDKFIEIDADDETKAVTILKDGEAIEASALSEYDILSVYADGATAKVVIVEVAGEQVVGTVSSKKDSKASLGGKAFKVNDTWYDVAAGAYKYTDLDVAEGGTIYIDKFGKIAAFIEDSALAGGLTANYAYVLGMEAEKAAFGGAGVNVNVQLVTAEGVKILPLKSNFVYEDESQVSYDVDLTKWTYDDANKKVTSKSGSTPTADKVWGLMAHDYSTDTTPQLATAADGIKATVIKYVVNSNGAISRITEAGFDTDKFKTTGVNGASQAYDADNSKFANGYVDSDTIVFIIGNATTSRVGTLADLDHENTYNVDAAYADNKAEDTNIIVVRYSDLLTSKTSSIAVIKEAGYGVNAAEEAIWTVTYLIDGEEVTANTDADTANGTIPTPGDIVKVKLDGNGVITNISSVWDFKANIRPADLNEAGDADTASATEIATFNGTSTAKEEFYGGVVLGYKETSTEAKLNVADTDATPTDIKLSRAANVYVIDALGRTTIIKNGSDANFKAFEALYDNTKTAAAFTLADDDNSTADVVISAGAGSQTSAQAYADHVYVRTYEDRATDVVIVKSALKKVQ